MFVFKRTPKRFLSLLCTYPKVENNLSIPADDPTAVNSCFTK